MGERVGEAAQENEIQRKEVMVCIYFYSLDGLFSGKQMFLFICLLDLFQSVSENLLQELNRFVDVASQQRARLEASQTSAVTDVAFDCVGI